MNKTTLTLFVFLIFLRVSFAQTNIIKPDLSKKENVEVVGRENILLTNQSDKPVIHVNAKQGLGKRFNFYHRCN